MEQGASAVERLAGLKKRVGKKRPRDRRRAAVRMADGGLVEEARLADAAKARAQAAADSQRTLQQGQEADAEQTRLTQQANAALAAMTGV